MAAINLEIKDIIKGAVLILTLAGMWYDLKTDFAVHIESHKLIEYRISDLEKANRMVSAVTYNAITPTEIRLRNDKQTYKLRGSN